MKHRTIKQFVVAIVAGVAAAVATGIALGWDLAALAGWDGFLVVFMLQIIASLVHNSTKVIKTEVMSHSMLDTIVVVASVASLGAVIVLITGKQSGIAHIIFGLVSVVLSWIAVHTLFMLRYAALYYHKGAPGGIEFNNKDGAKPMLSDFAYLAFTIGMTYQVSDTVVEDSAIRRTVLMQALVAFIFGVVIIASTINFMISLAQ